MGKKKKAYWSETHRPIKLDDLCGQDSMKNTIRRLLQNPDELTHILLYGPPGVGKTTVAFIIAYELYGSQWKLYTKYVNASEERKLENIREIKSFAGSRVMGTAKHKFKLVILDEADYLHITSQPALRSLMENLAGKCKFIITCNYVDKIILPLRSRATELHVRKATRKALAKMIIRVAKAEKVQGMNNDLVKLIIRGSKKDFRKAINILQASVDNGVISRERIIEVTNLLDEQSLSQIFSVLDKEGITACIELTRKYMDKGILPESVVDTAFEVMLDKGYFENEYAIDLLELFSDAASKMAYGVMGSIIVPWFVEKLHRIIKE